MPAALSAALARLRVRLTCLWRGHDWQRRWGQAGTPDPIDEDGEMVAPWDHTELCGRCGTRL